MHASIGKLVNLLSRNLQQELKEVVEPFGITVGEEAYYMELVAEDGITQEALTARVNVNKAATARAVSSLEAKGILIRKADEDDKRIKLLYLTEKGRAMYEPLAGELRKFNKRFTENLSEEEYDIILQGLNRLYEESNKRQK